MCLRCEFQHSLTNYVRRRSRNCRLSILFVNVFCLASCQQSLNRFLQLFAPSDNINCRQVQPRNATSPTHDSWRNEKSLKVDKQSRILCICRRKARQEAWCCDGEIEKFTLKAESVNSYLFSCSLRRRHVWCGDSVSWARWDCFGRRTWLYVYVHVGTVSLALQIVWYEALKRRALQWSCVIIKNETKTGRKNKKTTLQISL